jgi:L-ascorbate metabolism protein UlaG (beta-lactamase superfamily)
MDRAATVTSIGLKDDERQVVQRDLENPAVQLDDTFDFRGLMTQENLMAPNIEWLGNASFRLSGEGKVVYIDPFALQSDKPKADLILVTHRHGDHFSKEDIDKIRTQATVIAGPEGVASRLAGCETLGLNDERVLAGLRVTTLPAYNLDKLRDSGQPFHPRGEGIGIVVELAGERVYHAGDSDPIPEMEGLEPDVALVPVSGTYVMTAEEAAAALRSIRPRRAIPMHWGSVLGGELVGSRDDARLFAEMADVPVEIKERSS